MAPTFSSLENTPDPYRRVWRSLRPGLAATGAISAVISVLMLTGSIYMLQVYDRVLASGSVPTLVGLFVIVTVLYGFLGFFDFLRTRMLSRLALRLDHVLGAQAFHRWLGSAQPAAQPLRELDAVRGFLSGPAMSGLFDLPWVPLYLAVLFMVHPWLGWLTIGGAGIVAVLAWAGHRMTQSQIARSLTDDAIARDFADRSQRNAEMIRAMGMVGSVGARWRQLQAAGLAAGQQAGNPAEVIGAASRAFRMLMQSAILTLGAYLVIQGQMSGGMIIASSILTGRALAPVDQVIGQWRGIGKALESHRRLAAFFAADDGLAPVVALPAPTGQISVSNLVKLAPQKGRKTDAAQLTDRPRLLDGISFDLAPGDAMGVIGASASGKSTLARLLAGSWALDGGEIRLDGATRDQWDPAELGRHIGYLPQQVDLLPGTLRDNIARFDPEITDAQVMAAAIAAGVHDMILHLPDGYAARVGGLGESTPLSGGQVQRVGLARALCGQPALVILDEPNSNLDAAGEASLARAITGLREAGSTVIVMAHRPNVLLATNKLLILSEGRMVKFGDRDALAAGPNLHVVSSQPAPQAAPQPIAAQPEVAALAANAS
ncbi:MAG: type I secretion system permease/ATPase, partial [Paracoccaceae bacterium]